MTDKVIGFYAVNETIGQPACFGDSLIVMGQKPDMKKFIRSSGLGSANILKMYLSHMK